MILEAFDFWNNFEVSLDQMLLLLSEKVDEILNCFIKKKIIPLKIPGSIKIAALSKCIIT